VCVITASAKINALLKEMWEKSKDHLKQLLAGCRKVVICLDGWSKKGFSSHFLGISACFYDPSAAVARHVVLQLTKIDHPHTADKMATALNDCLTEWEPGSDKVMMIVSYNGSNMVKAIQLLKDMNTDDDCLSESDGEMTVSE